MAEEVGWIGVIVLVLLILYAFMGALLERKHVISILKDFSSTISMKPEWVY